MSVSVSRKFLQNAGQITAGEAFESDIDSVIVGSWAYGKEQASLNGDAWQIR